MKVRSCVSVTEGGVRAPRHCRPGPARPGTRPRRLRGKVWDGGARWTAGAARRCSSGVEQLTCNQQVVGSTPTIGSSPPSRNRCGEVPEWPKGADCKSAGECLRRFESSPLHSRCEGTTRIMSRGSSSGGRARAFQARGRGFDSRLPLIDLGARPVLGRCAPSALPMPPDPVGWRDRSRGQPPAHVAQAAEHFLGKEEVTGSNPVVGLGTGRARCAI